MKVLNTKYYQISLVIAFLFLNVQFLSAQSYAQKTGSEKMYLSDLFSQLKQEKEVTFLYEPTTIKGIEVTYTYDKEAEVKTILKEILPAVNLKFRRVGKYNYVIKKAKIKKNKKTIPINQKPQKKQLGKIVKKTIEISGLVTCEDTQETLIGATVWLENENRGTMTDEKGRFNLKTPIGQQVMIISYIGYEEKEIIIHDSYPKNISLSPVSTELDEIIITAVGLEANKRNIGYAIDNFDSALINQSGKGNLLSGLSAKSAGVWVNTASGTPGASTSVFIRGLRSVNGSNKPLFILDGIPVDNSTFGNSTGGVDVSNRLIDINQDDIEKITILKGASATALYGIRAANGAIVLTSKKGKQGRTKIAYSSSWGMSQVNKLPPQQNIYAQGKFINNQASYFGPESNVSSSYGAPLAALEFDGATDYPYDQNGRLVPRGQGNGIPANTYNAYETLFGNGQTMQNYLAASGGTNWFDYYLSLGQFRETGVIPLSSFDRYSLKGAFQVRLHEKFQIGMSSYLVHSSGIRMKRGSLLSGVPVGLYRNPASFDIGNGLKGKEAANTPSTYMLENGTQRSFRGNGRYDNPFWSINRNPFEDNVNRLIQNVHFNYQITPWLQAKYKIGLDIYEDARKSVYDINAGSHRNGQIHLFNIGANNINSDFLISIDKQIHKDWFFQATLGHNFFHSSFLLENTRGNDLKKQGVYTISNAINIETNEQLLRKKVAGVFADVHWRYKNILYLNFTGRNDWSSTLPKNNNAFFYPGINLGFEFTEGLGLTDSPYLSYGKLRISVSKVGNDAGMYLTETYFRPAIVNGDELLPDTNFPAFGISAFERSGTLGNPNLKPETTNSLEVGMVTKWLKGKIHFDATWYKSIHQDQIVNAQVSATSGFLNLPTNAGTIENEGIELMLILKAIQQKNFSWTIGINFSKFESIVTNFSNNQGIVLASFTNIASMILEGEPFGVLVGASIKKDALGRNIIDEDGFPKVNENHTVIGDPNPDWLLGMEHTFRWKQFTLNGLIDVRKGGDIWNGTKGVMSYLGISKISGDNREIRDYVFEGVTESGEVNTKAVDLANPVNGMEGIYWRRYGFIGLAEDHIEDGSWIRLRELNLAYQFSPNWFKSNTPQFKISLHGYNLILITQYTGVDPETNLRGDSNILGWDYFTMPSTKGWRLKLSATF